MIDSKGLDELAQRLANAMPPGLRGLRDELEQNFRAILHSGLDRLDLVSREQFETQREVLSRTRSKLKALEKRVAELEAAMDAKAPAGGEAASKSASGSRSGARKTTTRARKSSTRSRSSSKAAEDQPKEEG